MSKQKSTEVQTRQVAIVALLTNRNVPEAARASGIRTQTLYRWMKDPEFDAAYRAARVAVAAQEAFSTLRQGSRAAAATIVGIMLDSGVAASTRLSAAEFILGIAKEASENGAR